MNEGPARSHVSASQYAEIVEEVMVAGHRPSGLRAVRGGRMRTWIDEAMEAAQAADLEWAHSEWGRVQGWSRVPDPQLRRLIEAALTVRRMRNRAKEEPR